MSYNFKKLSDVDVVEIAENDSIHAITEVNGEIKRTAFPKGGSEIFEIEITEDMDAFAGTYAIPDEMFDAIYSSVENGNSAMIKLKMNLDDEFNGGVAPASLYSGRKFTDDYVLEMIVPICITNSIGVMMTSGGMTSVQPMLASEPEYNNDFDIPGIIALGVESNIFIPQSGYDFMNSSGGE